MSAATAAGTPTAGPTITDTLAHAAESLAAALQQTRGKCDTRIVTDGGYDLWAMRMGQAATVIITRHGEGIDANALDLVAQAMRLPAAATWRLDRWHGQQNIAVQAAVCVYEIPQ